MAKKKNRLQRKPAARMKNSRLESMNGLDLQKTMKDLSNVQVEAYAKVKGKDPISKAIKQAALKEVARRNQLLAKWKRGVGKKPLFELPKPRELPKEAIKEIRKGVGFLGKAISGELAREIEEDIATAGMSPKQKKAWKQKQVAAKRKRLAQARAEEAEFRRYGFGG